MAMFDKKKKKTSRNEEPLPPLSTMVSPSSPPTSPMVIDAVYNVVDEQRPYQSEQRPFCDEDDRPLPTNWCGDAVPGINVITEKHVACVFLLDTSFSMNNEPIERLMKGVQAFKAQVMNNPSISLVTKECIDVAMVSFGGDVKVVQDFVSVREMKTPNFTASGGTPLGQALEKAMQMVKARKELYNKWGTPYFRPWIVVITDGRPTDNYLEAAYKLREMEKEKGVLGYCIGVEGYDKNAMREIFQDSRHFRLEDMDFVHAFEFLSSSLCAVRESEDGTKVIECVAPHTLKMAIE